MATDNSITILPPGGIQPAALQQALTGAASVEQRDGNTYITEVNLSQQIVNEYQTVSQTTNSVTNLPAGASNGVIQYYNNGNFASNTFLRWDEPTSTLQVVGNVVSVGVQNSGTVDTLNLAVTGIANIDTLNVVGYSAFTQNMSIGNITTPRTLTVYGDITGGNLTIGNAGNVRTVTVVGNVVAENYVGANLVHANYFRGVLTADSNNQPNITDVSSTLSVGNVKLVGNTTDGVITANTGANLQIGATDGGGTLYAVNLQTTGNITLPQAQSGRAVVNTAGDLTILASTANYAFGQNGVANLANTVLANYFTGVLTSLSANQPNITAVGTLTSLTVANSGAGNTSSDNLLVGNLSNTANLVVSNTANIVTANIGNLWVTANANVTQLNAVDGQVSGNLSVGGNLFVAGNTTSINVTDLNVQDPLISLGGGANGSPLTTNDGKDRGSLLQYYTSTPVTAFMGWDNSNGEFALGSNVSVTAEVVAFNALGNLRAHTLYANLGGNLYNGNTSVTLAPNSVVSVSVAGNANIMVVTGTGANVTGYANITGNLSAANAALGNLATANYFTGNLVWGTTSVLVAPSSDVAVSVAGASNVLVVGAASANVTGNVNVTGNLTAANILGAIANGNSNITLLANSNVAVTSGGNTVLVVTPPGANIVGYANITGNLLSGNASLGNLATANYFTGNLVAGTSNVVVATGANVTVGIAGNPNILTVHTAGITVTGNVRATFANIQSSIITDSATFEIANTTATTLNIGGAATALNLGAATGNTTVRNNLVVTSGNAWANSGTVHGNVVSAGAYFQLPVYATTVDRDAAIPTPANGMMIYNTSINKFQGYAGGAWVDLN